MGSNCPEFSGVLFLSIFILPQMSMWPFIPNFSSFLFFFGLKGSECSRHSSIFSGRLIHIKRNQKARALLHSGLHFFSMLSTIVVFLSLPPSPGHFRRWRRIVWIVVQMHTFPMSLYHFMCVCVKNRKCVSLCMYVVVCVLLHVYVSKTVIMCMWLYVMWLWVCHHLIFCIWFQFPRSESLICNNKLFLSSNNIKVTLYFVI